MVNRPASPVKGEGSIKLFNLKTNNLMKTEPKKHLYKSFPIESPDNKMSVMTSKKPSQDKLLKQVNKIKKTNEVLKNEINVMKSKSLSKT